MRRPLLPALVSGALLAACTPGLDWREVAPEGSRARAQFPCKPKSMTRQAALAGAPTRMTLLSCEAEGSTFALAHAQLGDPARVSVALEEMAAALAANIASAGVRSQPITVPGMTPNAGARRIWLQGRLPDATPVQEQAVLFAHATQVYQAVVLGPRPGAAADVFIDSLRVVP